MASWDAAEAGGPPDRPSGSGTAPATDTAIVVSRAESTEDLRFVHGGGEEDSVRGYLFKMTRSGQWQRRWFETKGCWLTYYRSRRMTKLLAALNLLDATEIGMLDNLDEPEAHVRGEAAIAATFYLQLQGRKYILRADSRGTAEAWVRELDALRWQAEPGRAVSAAAEGLAAVKDIGGVADETRSLRGWAVCLLTCGTGCACADGAVAEDGDGGGGGGGIERPSG